MKVLHSYHIWLPLTMSWLYNQVRYLPKEVRSEIYCDYRDSSHGFDLPEMHSLEDLPLISAKLNFYLRKVGLSRFSPHLRKTLQSSGYDLLHAHFGNTGWELMPAANADRIPLVTTFYGIDVNYLPKQRPVWYKRYLRLFHYASLILCEGPFMKQSISELGCSPDKIRVHHLGVELNKLPFKPRKPEGETTKILIAGSFREKKGISYAFEALRKLTGKHKLQITIIGDAAKADINKREPRRIYELMQSPELKDHITHLGFQSHDKLIETALDHHLFLSPSVTAADGDSEGGAPVVLIEMTATGMPVISTTHCDIPNVIRHQENGLLAEERNPEQLASHLDYLIDHPDQWDAMGRRGREIAEEDFDVTRQGQRLGEIYSAVINQTRLPEDQRSRLHA